MGKALAGLAAVAAIIVGVVVITGGDDDSSGGGDGADLARWCEIGDELTAISEAIFADIQGTATEEKLAEASKRLVDENGDLLNELRETAPAEVDADVDRLYANLIEGAESGNILTPQGEDAAAQKRVNAFQDKNCGTGDEPATISTTG